MFYSFVNEHKQAGWDAWQTAGDSSDGAQQRCCVELRVQESSCCGKHILLTVPWQPWSSRFTQYDREYFKNLCCCCWKTQRCLLQNVILCMLGKYGKPVDMVPASAGRIKSRVPCVQTSVWIKQQKQTQHNFCSTTCRIRNKSPRGGKHKLTPLPFTMRCETALWGWTMQCDVTQQQRQS